MQINVGIVSPTSVIRTHQCSEGKGSNISIISFQGCISSSLINRQLRNHDLPTESFYELGPYTRSSSISFQGLMGTLASGESFTYTLGWCHEIYLKENECQENQFD